MKHRLRETGLAVVRVGGVSLLGVGCALIMACGGGEGTKVKTTTTTAGSTDNTGDTSTDTSSTTEPTTTTDGGDSNASTSGSTGTNTTTSSTSSTPTTTTKTTTGAAMIKKPAAKKVVPKKLRTTKSPTKMSQFLVKGAKVSLKKKRFTVAIPLMQGLVVARGDGSKEAYQLAVAWADQGTYDRAIAVFDRFIAATPDFGMRSKARRQRNNLSRASNPFAKQFQPNAAQTRRYATIAFRKGRAAFKKKKYADAQLYFRMGAAINPNLPGFLRELGATYDKLGMPAQKIKFYYRYLRRRPFGKNANTIRKALRRTKGLLTPLIVKSSMKCQELWINGQKIKRAASIMEKKVMVAPGKYRGLCLNYKYNFGMFENSFVRKGKPGTLEFRWTVVENKLQNPSGRITLEDARSGKMRSLALVPRQVGVVIPKGSRSLKVVLTSLNRAKKVTRFIKFQPGQKEVIKW